MYSFWPFRHGQPRDAAYGVHRQPDCHQRCQCHSAWEGLFPKTHQAFTKITQKNGFGVSSFFKTFLGAPSDIGMTQDVSLPDCRRGYITMNTLVASISRFYWINPPFFGFRICLGWWKAFLLLKSQSSTFLWVKTQFLSLLVWFNHHRITILPLW